MLKCESKANGLGETVVNIHGRVVWDFSQASYIFTSVRTVGRSETIQFDRRLTGKDIGTQREILGYLEAKR